MPPPVTRPSLLARLRESQNHLAWNEFAELYLPALSEWARLAAWPGIAPDDLVQEVFLHLRTQLALGKYSSEKGRFRDWLQHLLRNKSIDMGRKEGVRNRHERAAGSSLGEGTDPAEVYLEREFLAHVRQRALAMLRAEFPEMRWRAFWLTRIEGNSGDEAAKLLNISVSRVRSYTCQVLSRLRERFQDLLE